MKKSIYKSIVFLICISIVFSLFAISLVAETSSEVAETSSETTAHWKFQNVEGYYSGDLKSNSFMFKDLTQNGNDLTVKSTGNTATAVGDFFKWVAGSNLKASSETALFFNNTQAMAEASGAPIDSFIDNFLPTGKFFSTVDNAPMNDATFEKGYTFEVIFMADENLNFNYNRYAGIFSRQGMHQIKYGDGPNEPFYSMAFAEWAHDDDGSFTEELGLQLVESSLDGSFTVNKEFAYGDLEKPVNRGDWCHFAVINDGNITSCYVNGELLFETEDGFNGISFEKGYGWDVGVGRKIQNKEDSIAEVLEKGSVRRLFCGAISEIRVTAAPLDISKTLLSGPVEYKSEEVIIPEDKVEIKDENPTTSDFYYNVFAFLAVCSIIASYIIINKNKAEN